MIAKGEMLRSLVSNLPRRKSQSRENLYMDIAGLDQREKWNEEFTRTSLKDGQR